MTIAATTLATPDALHVVPLCYCQCDAVASEEHHSDRMHVAMVAQDLVVSKQPEAFHTHDIPSVQYIKQDTQDTETTRIKSNNVTNTTHNKKKEQQKAEDERKQQHK